MTNFSHKVLFHRPDIDYRVIILRVFTNDSRYMDDGKASQKGYLRVFRNLLIFAETLVFTSKV